MSLARVAMNVANDDAILAILRCSEIGFWIKFSRRPTSSPTAAATIVVFRKRFSGCIGDHDDGIGGKAQYARGDLDHDLFAFFGVKHEFIPLARPTEIASD